LTAASQREFYSPQYQKKSIDENRCDLRRLLYWSPQVQTNKGKAGLSFYTSNIEADMPSSLKFWMKMDFQVPRFNTLK
jgi:hypothetical protein